MAVYATQFDNTKTHNSRMYADFNPLRRKKPSSQTTTRPNDRFDFDSPFSRSSLDDSLQFNLDALPWETKLSEMRHIVKNVYKESPSIANMSSEQADIIRQQFVPPVRVLKSNLNPIPAFEDLQFSGPVQSIIKRRKMDKPTAIQSQSLPVALSGRDLIGVAETGSGKTLAYGLPALEHILAQELTRETAPETLMIAPTRELAQQIRNELQDFARAARLRVQAFYGGSRKGESIRELQRYGPPNIAVATPGRLLDMVSSGELALDNVSYFVIDEADRMLDMGFEPQLKQIVGQLRPDRQTLMWSATWPIEIQKLAYNFLTDPAMVVVGRANKKSVANKNVKQEFGFVANPRARVKAMVDFLARVEREVTERATQEGNVDTAVKVLIFCQTRRDVDNLMNELEREGYPVSTTHGGKTQSARDRALRDFKRGNTPIMIATDVAARGLDIKDIGYVVNYSLPQTLEDYIHRIGRTGRAGATGVAYSIITPDDAAKHAQELTNILEEVGQEIPPQLSQALQAIKRRNPSHSRSGNNNRWNRNTQSRGPLGRRRFGTLAKYN